MRQRLKSFDPVYAEYPDKLRVLVAGCGTGHHPISIALQNPDYIISAIDLSRESLRYASFMTKKYKISNISYYQCDILNVNELNQRFDHIDCGGVIHHMDNQDLAWETLSSVLLPGGTLNVSVYASIARMEINKLRDSHWKKCFHFERKC